MQVVKDSILGTVFPKRTAKSKKYDFGSLLVIGGSNLYHGSPVFNALAAYCAGVDLVTLVGPRRSMDLAACSGGPDLVTYPLDCDYFAPTQLDKVLNISKEKTAFVIGGGMGRRQATSEFIIRFLKASHLPVVIDADAIYALAEYPEVLANRRSLITPHSYEFKKLIGDDSYTSPELSLEEKVKQAGLKFSSTVLLKGSTDLISNGETAAKNKTGSSYMTVGGTGDVLAGLCGGLLAKGVEPFKTACAAVYINGKAGELAAGDFGPSMMATDVLAYIPDVIK